MRRIPQNSLSRCVVVRITCKHYFAVNCSLIFLFYSNIWSTGNCFVSWELKGRLDNLNKSNIGTFKRYHSLFSVCFYKKEDSRIYWSYIKWEKYVRFFYFQITVTANRSASVTLKALERSTMKEWNIYRLRRWNAQSSHNWACICWWPEIE